MIKSAFTFFGMIMAQLAVTSAVFAADFSGQITLEMRNKSTVSGARTYLSDIAKCKGAHDICRQIPGIDVGANPLPGRSTLFSQSAIEQILEKELPGVAIDWVGADACRIEAAAAEIPFDEIKSQFQKSVATATKKWSNEGRVEITKIQASVSFGIRPTQTKIEFPDRAVAS